MKDSPDFIPLVGYDNRPTIDETFRSVEAAQARINALESALAALHAFTENHFQFCVKPVGVDALLGNVHRTLYGPYIRKGEREAEKAAESARYEVRKQAGRSISHMPPDPHLVRVNRKLAEYGLPTKPEFIVSDDF